MSSWTIDSMLFRALLRWCAPDRGHCPLPMDGSHGGAVTHSARMEDGWLMDHVDEVSPKNAATS